MSDGYFFDIPSAPTADPPRSVVGPHVEAVTEEGEAKVTASAPLVITVHGTPAPQGSKRHVGNGVMIESSKKVKPWRQDVKYAALEAVTGTRWFKTEAAVEVRVTFSFTRPKSHYRTGRNAHLLRDGAPAYPSGKPDIDKLLRSTLDALGEATIFRDDAQVVDVRMRKIYGPSAGAHIVVREVAA